MSITHHTMELRRDTDFENPEKQCCLLFVEDRQYRKFYLTKEKQEVNIPERFDPLEEKLFDQDEIELNHSDNTVSLIHSPVRQHRSIPGVLILANKKTFGRIGTKMLYQCQPDDKHLPTFLVPYQGKQKFSKNPVNKYVTFEFVSWTDKHPRGKLTNTLGSVDDLPSFYEYQLYCKSLNASIQNFTRDAAQALKKKTEEEFIEMILAKYPTIHNKIDNKTKIFAIDPKHSRDYDDAFDIEIISDNEYKICVYISNVPLWMECLICVTHSPIVYQPSIYQIKDVQCFLRVFLSVYVVLLKIRFVSHLPANFVLLMTKLLRKNITILPFGYSRISVMMILL